MGKQRSTDGAGSCAESAPVRLSTGTVAERLRRKRGDWQNPEQALLNEAADRIEALEREFREVLEARDIVGLLVGQLVRFIEERATISGYGFYRPANPHNFSPDHDSCSPEEIAAHKAACEAWDKGEYQALNPEDDYIRDGDGKLVMHILRAPWGIGSYNETDPEAEKLIDAARAYLCHPRPGEG